MNTIEIEALTSNDGAGRSAGLVRKSVRWCLTAGLVASGFALVAPAVTHADSPAAAATPGFIPANADWLTSVNYYRAMSGLAPVTEDASLDGGAAQHSCYMLSNGISHGEVAGNPGYSAAGDTSGNNSDVAVSSTINATSRSFVELWMTGPFHALGVLRPGLTSVGFGRCDQATTPTYHSGATLDILHGLSSRPALTTPILFPGAGTTTSLNKFVVESPNPLDSCGWTGQAGLPILALMPESTVGASSTITGANGPLETCTVSAANSTGTAQQLLAGDNVVVAIPKAPLADGTYHVTMHTNARDIAWDFTVDQAAANGPATPTPITTTPITTTPTTSSATVNAVSTGPVSTMQPLTPARIVDTRTNHGATPLTAGGMQRIQVTGTAGVPAGATAVVANITATQAASDGYITMWNCAGTRPNASTLNFSTDQNVPNSATIPLDAQGEICVYSYAATQLIVDVTGYDAPGATGNYNPVTPTRIMDTRSGQAATRMNAGQTVQLQVTGTAGVPANASAVALNVTSDNASTLGVVTVYPCGTRPDASNLNPAPGETHANLVTTALSATGSVCLFSLQPTELIVDVFGYFAPTGTKLTVVTPFRFTDTRDTNPALNNGRGATKLTAGTVVEIQIAGARGIPTNAKAISANITATNATNPGWIAAWPCTGTAQVSNVNYGPAAPVANNTELTLTTTGTICVVAYTNVDVIIDINGWWN